MKNCLALQEKALHAACTYRQYVTVDKELLDRSIKRLEDGGGHDKVSNRSLERQLAHTIRGYGAEQILTLPSIGGTLSNEIGFDVNLPVGLPIGPRIEVKTSSSSGMFYDHKVIFEFWPAKGPKLEEIITRDGPEAVIGYRLEYEYVRTEYWNGEKLKSFRWLERELY